MALTRRQQRLYTDTVDIFKPEATSLVDRVSSDPRYPATPTVAGVLAYLFTSTEFANPQPHLGRTNEDMMLTLDKLHVEAAVDIDDAFVFQLKTSGHPDEGGYWMVMGNAKVRTTRGRRTTNYKEVLCKRMASAPAGVSI